MAKRAGKKGSSAKAKEASSHEKNQEGTSIPNANKRVLAGEINKNYSGKKDHLPKKYA